LANARQNGAQCVAKAIWRLNGYSKQSLASQKRATSLKQLTRACGKLGSSCGYHARCVVPPLISHHDLVHHAEYESLRNNLASPGFERETHGCQGRLPLADAEGKGAHRYKPARTARPGRPNQIAGELSRCGAADATSRTCPEAPLIARQVAWTMLTATTFGMAVHSFRATNTKGSRWRQVLDAGA